MKLHFNLNSCIPAFWASVSVFHHLEMSASSLGESTLELSPIAFCSLCWMEMTWTKNLSLQRSTSPFSVPLPEAWDEEEVYWECMETRIWHLDPGSTRPWFGLTKYCLGAVVLTLNATCWLELLKMVNESVELAVEEVDALAG